MLEAAGLVTTVRRGPGEVALPRRRADQRHRRSLDQPVRVWQALTDPEFTRRYWGVVLASDRKVGSTLTLEQRGVTVVDPAQVVLESEPHRRLASTFHTFTPDFIESVGFSDEVATKVASGRRSQVAFDIEPLGDKVKLTVIHDGLEPGSAVLELISGGWPAVLANLKTLLETGVTLPAVPDMAR